MKPILKDSSEFPTIENLAKHLSPEDLKLYQKLLEERFYNIWCCYSF